MSGARKEGVIGGGGVCGAVIIGVFAVLRGAMAGFMAWRARKSSGL